MYGDVLASCEDEELKDYELSKNEVAKKDLNEEEEKEEEVNKEETNALILLDVVNEVSKKKSNWMSKQNMQTRGRELCQS